MFSNKKAKDRLEKTEQNTKTIYTDNSTVEQRWKSKARQDTRNKPSKELRKLEQTKPETISC